MLHREHFRHLRGGLGGDFSGPQGQVDGLASAGCVECPQAVIGAGEGVEVPADGLDVAAGDRAGQGLLRPDG